MAFMCIDWVSRRKTQSIIISSTRIILVYLCESFSHRLPHESVDDWIDTRVCRRQQERRLTQITLNVFVGAVCGIQELKLVRCPGNYEYGDDQSTHPGNLAQQHIIRVWPLPITHLEKFSGFILFLFILLPVNIEVCKNRLHNVLLMQYYSQ